MYLIKTEKNKISDRYTRTNELIQKFGVAIKSFRTRLKKIFPTISSPEHIRKTTEQSVRKLMIDMNENNEQIFQEILEDGIARAGINLTTRQVDPNTVRQLYYNSPLFEAYKNMNDRLVKETNDIITKHVLQEGGMNYRKLTDELTSVANLSEKRARVIARTETQVVQNKGRELGWRITDPEGKNRYRWGGPYDRRTSDACEWVRKNTPRGGLPMEELKKLVRTATDKFYPKLSGRDWSVHPNCRHFPQRLRSVDYDNIQYQ